MASSILACSRLRDDLVAERLVLFFELDLEVRFFVVFFDDLAMATLADR